MGEDIDKMTLDKYHERIVLMNGTVFGCLKLKEAYNTDMPFRFCPSCGKKINETENSVKRLLKK